MKRIMCEEVIGFDGSKIRVNDKVQNRFGARFIVSRFKQQSDGSLFVFVRAPSGQDCGCVPPSELKLDSWKEHMAPADFPNRPVVAERSIAEVSEAFIGEAASHASSVEVRVSHCLPQSEGTAEIVFPSHAPSHVILSSGDATFTLGIEDFRSLIRWALAIGIKP